MSAYQLLLARRKRQEQGPAGRRPCGALAIGLGFFAFLGVMRALFGEILFREEEEVAFEVDENSERQLS